MALSEGDIEAIAVKHEEFEFGQVDKYGYTTHGFGPEGLRAFVVEVCKDDEALIRQLVEALEHIHRCIPIGGFAQIHWGSSTFEQIVQAAEAGRARLEQAC